MGNHVGFSELNEMDYENVNGGVFTITILGVAYTGAKAYAIVTGGVGLIGLGIWNGYNDTK